MNESFDNTENKKKIPVRTKFNLLGNEKFRFLIKMYSIH